MTSDQTWIGLAMALLVVVFWALWWRTTPTDTNRRRLGAWLPRRLVRWYRLLLVRMWLFPVGWPHLVDLAFGAGRRHAGVPDNAVWRAGSATLQHFDSGPHRYREPVLVVHALVTKPWILDLTPRRSLVRMLLARGFDVYLLDWGDPGRAEASRGLADCAAILEQAEQVVCERTGVGRVHLIGYCLAGTLVLQSLSARPRPTVGSIALVAPLVDFAVPGGFHRWLTHRSFRPVLALDGTGCVPASVVREAFHALRPRALQALRRRWARRKNPEYREFYAAMARWAWTHRRLPGALFFDVVDLYRKNPFVPARGPSPLTAIDVPVLLALAERDHIVPSGASHALTAVTDLDVTTVNVASGHVSMLVGDAAQTTTWPALATFLETRQGG